VIKSVTLAEPETREGRMRPRDCETRQEELRLNEQGISTNGTGIQLDGGRIVLTVGPCTVIVSRYAFIRIAEWYLEDQETDDDGDDMSPEEFSKLIKKLRSLPVMEEADGPDPEPSPEKEVERKR
jgi:hypothetical protein